MAQAVGKSIANPKIFQNFDAVEKGYLDPGTDRMARVPIDDACAKHPDSRILAVNVSGQPARYDSGLKCPVLEVRVDGAPVPQDALLGTGPEFAEIVERGRASVLHALAVGR